MKRAMLALGIAAHLGLQVWPLVERVREQPGARDYSSYHYAVQAAAAGEDPYTPANLSRRAQAEGTRRMVQPYYYPPPFLLSVLWALPLHLDPGFVAMAVLNEVLLGATLLVLHLAWGMPLWAVAMVLGTYAPVTDNLWMGQANLLASFPVVLGLVTRKGAGPGIATAASFKMSPAILLLGLVRARRWGAIAAALATALGLSVVSLLLVGPAAQARFYTEVFPGFLRGEYHGLKIAIALPANHSFAKLYALVWPGELPTRLSDPARLAQVATSVTLLAAWAWFFRQDERRSWAALVVLMVALPVYCFEHHLAMLLLPLGVLSGLARTLGRRVAFVVVYALLAVPGDWLLAGTGPAGVVLQEARLVGMLGLFALLSAWQGQSRASATVDRARSG